MNTTSPVSSPSLSFSSFSPRNKSGRPTFLALRLLQAAVASTFSTLASCCPTTPTRDPFAAANALSTASSSPPSMGSQLHARFIKLGMAGDTFTMNHLLTFYSRRGHLASALVVFDEMPCRNLVSWTAMVSASMCNGAPQLGLELFVSMIRSGFCPNEFALASVLGACQSMAHAKLGLLLHGLAAKTGLDGNPYVGSSLLLMYAKHGHISAAEHLFGNIVLKDLACWNALLEGYVSNGCGNDAMRTVVLMHQRGIASDVFTYISAVKASSTEDELSFGRQLHGLVIHNMFESDTSVMNALVDMYFKAGRKEVAMAIFSKIRRKDTVSWNTMISGLARDEDEKAVAGCFADMARCGCKPNQVTFSTMLRLSGAKENASLGLQIFGLAYCHGYSDNVLVANSVINMMSRCGMLNCAYGFFCNLSVRNIMTWNEMIAGYGLHNCSEDALRLFRSFVCFGARPGEFSYPAVLSAFQQAHDARNHEQIHAGILKHGFASCQFVSTSLIKAKAASGSIQGSLKVIGDAGKMDLVSWGVIISAFLKHGLNNEVLLLFNLFRSDCREKPDEFILATILNACANAALIRQCRCIHSLVVRTGHSKHFCVASALVDAYAKCGDITAAESSFTYVSPATADAILYNTMLTAYANHGLIHEALSLHQGMTQLQVVPTPATFIAVVSACSHLGLVEQGKLLFSSMLSEHGMNLTRASYACLVDLLARKGLLDEAKGVIEAMPFQPWPVVWRSLMNGCWIHGNKELGVLAAEQILRTAPSSDGAYVSLSNVYAVDGDWQSAQETRRRMAENQVHKVQGYSSVEI
ncbi:pentatricopeptide repeat-containing protein At4g13650-like [Phragmites australis]|uniref:pentatricopeptide repeat-containing protein At4g13650-like n=1 Tax=Phragmites australis TaxID=29695 RepID=UPI002D79C5B2|nr:pentatricopeptide repeat-containing protein At4g13650-like [Phragmites australis]